MNKALVKNVTLLLILLPVYLKSQIKEFESWNTFSVDWGVTQKTEFWMEHEFRFEDNATRFVSYNTVAGVKYKISKSLRVAGAYRYTYNIDNKEVIEKNHRFFIDIMIRHKWQRVILSYRPRYQMIFQQPTDDRFSNYNPQHLRHKWVVKYDVPKIPLSPFAECELFQSINNPVKNTIEKRRVSLGIEYSNDKNLNVEVSYRFENRSDYIHKNKNSNIIGIAFGYHF